MCHQGPGSLVILGCFFVRRICVSIYRAATAAEVEQHLAEPETKWKPYPSISQVWRRIWARVTPLFR